MGVRTVVVDIESSGLHWRSGDRIIEFAAIELDGWISTGKELHLYIKPNYPIHPDARAIHGITESFLADKPVFAEVADQIRDFIGESRIVAHNGKNFDFPFLNWELSKVGKTEIPSHRHVDTIVLSRASGGSSHSLDALCDRYGIDRSMRTHHSALVDTRLLARVYAELCCGTDPRVLLATAKRAEPSVRARYEGRKTQLKSRLTEEEERAHSEFVGTIPEAVWHDYGEFPRCERADLASDD